MSDTPVQNSSIPTTDAQSISNDSTAQAAVHIRWRGLLLIAVLTIIALAVIWLPERFFRDHRTVFTLITAGVSFLLFMIWLTFRSGIPWKPRLIAVSLIILINVSFWTVFKFEGFAGDMSPLLGWRFVPTVEEQIAIEREQFTPVTTHQVELSLPSFDHSQYQAIGGDAIIDSIQLETDWKKHPPKELWRRPVGLGWSGFVTAGQRAITQEQRKENEAVVCYDLFTGEERWVYEYPARFDSALGGDGPRSTPTVDGNRVYTLGATGILCALDIETGKPIWPKIGTTIDLVKVHHGRIPRHGYCGSVLIHNDQLLVSAGGRNDYSLLAFNKMSGELIWSAGFDRAGYATPQVGNVLGTKQFIVFNAHGFAGHDVNTGEKLWDEEWVTDDSLINVSQPRLVRLFEEQISGEINPTEDSFQYLLISSGYDQGTALFQLSQENEEWDIDQVWHSRKLRSKFSNVIVPNKSPHEGIAYGLDNGILCCLDLKTGERLWKAGRYGHGQLLMVGSNLLIQAESGEIALAEANPQAFKELARFQVLNARTWNHPALAGQYLIVRNDREAVCLLLPIAE